MQNQIWYRKGTEFWPTPDLPASERGPLQPGIYQLRVCPLRGGYLERLDDAFELPPKLYGLQRGFIDRIKKTASAIKTNVGVLMNGIRGTGKTVTGKVIANELKLPVILVSTAWKDLAEFLLSITEECVIFFDEFEKVFTVDEDSDVNKGSSLLPIMDGALTTGGRKIFLMTTNDLAVERNLLQRPGRVRYVRTFGNLSAEQVEEIATDRLVDKNRVPSLVRFVAQLEIITIDIVLSLCDEVNIHGEDPTAFQDAFNVQMIAEFYDVMLVVPNPESKDRWDKEREHEVIRRTKVWPPTYTDAEVGDEFMIQSSIFGEILEVQDEDRIVIKPNPNMQRHIEVFAAQNPHCGIAHEDVRKMEKMTFRVVPRRSWNTSYKRVARSGKFDMAYE